MLELRHGPMREALEAARPVLEAIGEALGPDGEVVLVPGNHDHRLIAPWLDWRARNGAAEPLGLEERAGPKRVVGTREHRAACCARRSLDVAYPGVWLATTSTPPTATTSTATSRSRASSASPRACSGASLRRARPSAPPSPDDYEVALAPMYALLDAIAARVGDGRAAAPGHALGARVASGCRPTAARACAGPRCSPARFPLAIAALNRVGHRAAARPTCSGVELRRAGLRAMGGGRRARWASTRAT